LCGGWATHCSPTPSLALSPSPSLTLTLTLAPNQVRLGNVVAWLGEQAEEMGVEIYSGQGGVEVLTSRSLSLILTPTLTLALSLALSLAVSLAVSLTPTTHPHPPPNKVLYNEAGEVVGVATNDVGVAKDGGPKVS
jgi:hypothetical protein